MKVRYRKRNLPAPEVTRFFIGVDYKKPKAFGIYKDENGELTEGNTVVQKIWTKPNGSIFYKTNGNDIKYIKDIVGVYDSSDPKPNHELYGCTDNFAMYNSTSAPEES